MRTRMYGGVRGRKTKVGGKSTFVFLLLDSANLRIAFSGAGQEICLISGRHMAFSGIGHKKGLFLGQVLAPFRGRGTHILYTSTAPLPVTRLTKSVIDLELYRICRSNLL